MPDQYRIKGAFFENLKGGGPAFTGFVEIDGVKTQIALWPKTSQAGQRYLQVSEDKKKPMAAGPVPPKAAPFKPRPRPSDMDDDIPF